MRKRDAADVLINPDRVAEVERTQDSRILNEQIPDEAFCERRASDV